MAETRAGGPCDAREMSTQGTVTPPGPASPAADAVPPSVRAQLLATEHWSLLATRSTTWSEVMGRIGIHLTVVSASLVVLALVAQATGFGTGFQVMSIGLASAALVLGTLTGLRVINASQDDAAMVLGMNLLRRAYIDLDPAMSQYLVTGWTCDEEGLMRTYTMGYHRHALSHVLGSTAMFMNVVNTIVAGTLGALVANVSGWPTVGVALVGVGAGVAFLAVMLEVARRVFSRTPFASPASPVTAR